MSAVGNATTRRIEASNRASIAEELGSIASVQIERRLSFFSRLVDTTAVFDLR